MRIVKVRPQFGDITVMDIEPQLYNLQSHVGGFIETTTLPELAERGILLIVNEEGLLNQLPVNSNLLPFLLVGNVLAVGAGDEDFTSLTDEQIRYFKEWLKNL